MNTIFVVDDSDNNFAAAEEVLEDCYNVMTAPLATKMSVFLEKFKLNFLLNIEMPEMKYAFLL